MNTDDTDQTGKSDEKPMDTARRKFLKAAVYVPPAVITTLMVSNANAADPSCAPNQPCSPAQGCPPMM